MNKNMLNRLLVALMTAAVLSACSAKKRLAESNATTTTATGKASLGDIRKKQTDYKTFSSRSKATVKVNGKAQDANLSLRIKKDEIIWASVTAFAGIEVARIYITPDSVKFINRLQSQYFEKPFSFLQQYAGRKIDFYSLQALMVGNSIPFTLEEGNVIAENGTLKVEGKTEGLSFSNLYNEDWKPAAVTLVNSLIRQQLKITYGDYVSLGGALLPSSLELSSEVNNQQVGLTIDYQQPQFNVNQEYPFNIPSRYTAIP